MALSQARLWNTIEHTVIAGEQALLFRQKLKDQHAWPDAFIDSAIIEYKRFLYLVAISDTSIPSSNIVPSKIVDEIWHLHLTFTRDYWQVWAKILGKEIHHNPSDSSDHLAFATSKALYATEFDCQPCPLSPPIKKSNIKKTFTLSASVFSLLLLTSYAVAAQSSDSFEDINWFFWGAGLLILILILRAIWPSKKGRGKNGNGSSNCSSHCSSSSDCSSSSCGSSCGGGD
jgi:hypothetical protein